MSMVERIPERVLSIDIDQAIVRGMVVSGSDRGVAGGYAQLGFGAVPHAARVAGRIAAALDVETTLPVVVGFHPDLPTGIFDLVFDAIRERGFDQVSLADRSEAIARANPNDESNPVALADAEIAEGLLASHDGLSLADLTAVVGAGLQALGVPIGGVDAPATEGPVTVWAPDDETDQDAVPDVSGAAGVAPGLATAAALAGSPLDDEPDIEVIGESMASPEGVDAPQESVAAAAPNDQVGTAAAAGGAAHARTVVAAEPQPTDLESEQSDSRRPLLGAFLLLLLLAAAAIIFFVVRASGGDDDSIAAPATTETDDGSSAGTEQAATAGDDTDQQQDAAPEPAVEPTAVPTAEPTVEPTAAPTVEPTAEPTPDPLEGLPPLSSLPERGAVFRPPTLYLEGPVRTQEESDQIYQRAIEVLGPDNVVRDHVIRPDAPGEIDGNVRVEQAVLFQTGSAVVAPDFFPTLDLGVLVMSLNPQVTMIVEGHTDDVGSDEINQVLSEARAQAALEYMVSRGISIDRLQAIGFGESSPVVANDSDQNRQINRRIEVQLLDLLAPRPE